MKKEKEKKRMNKKNNVGWCVWHFRAGSACNNLNQILLYSLMSSACPCQTSLASGSLVNRHWHQCSSSLKFLHTYFKVAQVSLCSYYLIKNNRRSNWSTLEPFHTEMRLCYRVAFAVNCHELQLMCILFKKTRLNCVDFMFLRYVTLGFTTNDILDM